MIGACRAEAIKLGHRPVVLVLALFATVPTAYSYLADYAGLRAQAAQGIGPPGESELALLLPHQLVQNVVVQLFDGGPLDGAVVGIMLGALIVGSDYSWGTLKTAFTQEPGRITVLSGQIVALGLVLLVLIILEFAASGVGSVLVALMVHSAIRFPTAGTLALGLLTVWLIVGAWSAVGVLLATASRGPAAAMGLGIAWKAGLEPTIQPLAAHSAAINALVVWLPAANTQALVASLTPTFSTGLPRQTPTLMPHHAVWVLVSYLVCAIALSAALIRVRDAT